MLTGAISGAIFGGIGGMGFTGMAHTVAHFAGGAASGAINASITGGDIGRGALIGGISAGASEWASTHISLLSPVSGKSIGAYLVNVTRRAALGGVIGGSVSASQGGRFWSGAQSGATTSAIAYTSNEFIHLAGAVYGAISGGIGGAIAGAASAQEQGRSPFWGAVKGAAIGGAVGALSGLLLPGSSNLTALQALGVGMFSSYAGQVSGNMIEHNPEPYTHISYGAVAGSGLGAFGIPILEACYVSELPAAIGGGGFAGAMEAAGDIFDGKQ
jgi:hypothetical protein